MDKREKPRAEYLGWSNHDCEAWYRCPVCGKEFGSWSVPIGSKECPRCHTELKGVE